METLRSDPQRLWQSLMDMARIGATPRGGSCRLALSDEDKAGRDLFAGWCEAAGLTVEVDRMGNLFARRPGREENLPAVGAGSHLDTQPHGGKFDGVYGVLAALEVARTLNDHGVDTRAPIDVVCWTNEEGARFPPAMLGSGVFAGVFDLDYGLSRADTGGATVGDELERIGYAGPLPCGERTFGAFFEAHIEQGPILERERKTIGVVLGGQGVRWYDARVTGQDSHAGSTPMAGRRDALLASARMIEAIDALARARKDAVATVGHLEVSPNSRNTIPGEVRFTIDMRHFDDDVLAEMDAVCREACAGIAAEAGAEAAIECIWHQPPVHFHASCVEAVRSAAERLGYPHRDIVSGAGHDAFLVSRVAPTGMVFVPCAGGISHNEAESAEPADLAAGCDVLLNAMLAQAQRP